MVFWGGLFRFETRSSAAANERCPNAVQQHLDQVSEPSFRPQRFKKISVKGRQLLQEAAMMSSNTRKAPGSDQALVDLFFFFFNTSSDLSFTNTLKNELSRYQSPVKSPVTLPSSLLSSVQLFCSSSAYVFLPTHPFIVLASSCICASCRNALSEFLLPLIASAQFLLSPL